jgi:hypothetical protein
MQVRPPGQIPSSDLQELWFSALRYHWSSLVIVPADRGISSLRIAEAMGEMGRIQTGAQLVHLRAEGLNIQTSSSLVTSMTALKDRPPPGAQEPWLDRQIIIAVDAVVANPAGVAVALAADAVLLHVVLGRTSSRAARRTIELIGQDRFIGCVVEK